MDATKQKCLSFQEVGQKRKIVVKNQNRIYPSLTLQTTKFVSLKRVFKNSITYCSAFSTSYVYSGTKFSPGNKALIYLGK